MTFCFLIGLTSNLIYDCKIGRSAVANIRKTHEMRKGMSEKMFPSLLFSKILAIFAASFGTKF